MLFTAENKNTRKGFKCLQRRKKRNFPPSLSLRRLDKNGPVSQQKNGLELDMNNNSDSEDDEREINLSVNLFELITPDVGSTY
jgi:hypothetical protein